MFTETEIPGLVVFEPRVFSDERGYFYESYNKQLFLNAGIDADFVQDNQSKSTKNVLRGLHFQNPPFAQAKLVRVINGSVLDIAVDLRQGSPTFKMSYQIILSDQNKKQLFIPRGFAHGFLVLSETAEFAYKCDNLYSKLHESGIRFDDPDINIDWGVNTTDCIISEKDNSLKNLNETEINFKF
jgi:dTDP-4-dehydrorhamnose 3,5-epimerase